MAQTKGNKTFTARANSRSDLKSSSLFLVLLFLIFINNDLFYLTGSTNVCKFAYDTTFYASDKNLNPLINRS